MATQLTNSSCKVQVEAPNCGTSALHSEGGTVELHHANQAVGSRQALGSPHKAVRHRTRPLGPHAVRGWARAQWPIPLSYVSCGLLLCPVALSCVPWPSSMSCAFVLCPMAVSHVLWPCPVSDGPACVPCPGQASKFQLIPNNFQHVVSKTNRNTAISRKFKQTHTNDSRVRPQTVDWEES